MQIGKKGLIVYLFRFVAPVFSLAFLSTILGVSIASPIQNTNAAGETTIGAEVIRVGFGLSVSVSPNITLDLEPTPTGTMTVGSSIVNAGTSSPSGYTLYLEMTGDNANTNSLIHSTDDTKRLTSSGSFAAPAALTNGTWGYAFEHDAESVLSTNGFDSSYSTMESATPTSAKFASIPTSGNPAQKIAETDTIGGVELTVYYGVRADYTTASGAYTNKILYTALADDGSSPMLAVSPSTISPDGGESIALTASLYSTFDDIAGDAYLLTPEQYAAVTDAQNPTPVSTYSSQKLTCSRDTTSDPYKLNCTTIAIASGTNYVYVDIPHYAQHYASTITVESTVQYFQDFTWAQCAAMSTGDSLTLRDSRDDNDYTVKKLADGNCWMTQNLRLVGPFQPDQSDSDVTWTKSTNTFTLPAQNTGTWCTAYNDATCIDTANNLYSGDSTYGTYYSWNAATAGTGTYSTSTDGANAPSSICPKGWRLPTGGSSGEFQALYSQYSSADLMINGAPAFVLSGYRYGSYTLDQSSNGYYWSSTAYTRGNAYRLSLDSSNVYPASSYNKYYGFTIRCLAK